MTRPVVLALALLVVAACASPGPVYGPSLRPGAAGYESVRIEENRFRVTFRGEPGASVPEVSEFALLRAAELTIEQGASWFVVDARSREAAGDVYSTAPRVSVGVAGGSSGRTAVGVGVGFGIGGLAGAPGPSVTLDIRVGAGPKPEGDVYDAAEVIANVGPRAGRA